MTDVINTNEDIFYWSLDITKEDANNIIDMAKETTTENYNLNDAVKVELEERIKECERIQEEIYNINPDQMKGLVLIASTGANISLNVEESLKTLEKEEKEKKKENLERIKKENIKKTLEADPMKVAYLGTTYEDKKSKIDYDASKDTIESIDDISQLLEQPPTEEEIKSMFPNELNIQKEGEEVSSVSNPKNDGSDSESDGEPDDNNSFLNGIISDSITDSLESLIVDEYVEEEQEKKESQSPENPDKVKEKISEAIQIEVKKLNEEANQLYKDISILQKKRRQLEEVSKFDYYLNYDINSGGFSFLLDLNTNPQTSQVQTDQVQTDQVQTSQVQTSQVQTGQQKYRKVFLFKRKKGIVDKQYYIVSKEQFTHNGSRATPLISFSSPNSLAKTILEYKDILTGSTKILTTIISEFTQNSSDLQSKIIEMTATTFASLTKEQKKTFNALLSRVVMQNYASIVKSPIEVKILSKYIYEFYSAFVVETETRTTEDSFHEKNPLLSQSDDNNNKNKSVFQGMTELQIYLIQCIFGHLIINVLFTRGYNKKPFKGKLLDEFKTTRVQAQEAAIQLAKSTGNAIHSVADRGVILVNQASKSFSNFFNAKKGGSHKINHTFKKNGRVKKIVTRKRSRKINKINYVGGMISLQQILFGITFSYTKMGPFKMWAIMLSGIPFLQKSDTFGNRYFYGARPGKMGGKLYNKVWSTNPMTIVAPFISKLQQIMTEQMNSKHSSMFIPFIFFEMIALILLYIIQLTDALQVVTFFTDIPPESIFILPFIAYVICRAVRIPAVVLYGIGDILTLHSSEKFSRAMLRSFSKMMSFIFIEPITQREEHFNDVQTIMQGGSRIKKTNYVSTILDEDGDDEHEQINMELFPKNSGRNKNKIHKEKTKTRRKM